MMGEPIDNPAFKRVKAWASSETPPPNKFSPGDVQKKLDDPRTRTRLRYVVAGVIVLLGFGFVISTGLYSVPNRSTEIDNLRNELASVQAAKKATTLNETKAKTALVDAGSAGAVVAQLQNDYKGLVLTTKRGDTTGQKILEIKRKIEKMFDGSDAGVRWYRPLNKDGTPLDPARYKWVYNARYDVLNGAKIPVSWQCVDDKDNVLAWTVATWNSSMNKFEAPFMGVTALGQDYLVSDDTTANN